MHIGQHSIQLGSTCEFLAETMADEFKIGVLEFDIIFHIDPM
jgi:hypothetical protein